MPGLRIERGKAAAAALTMTRGQVRPGQVFTVMNRDGSEGETEYAAVGNNGKSFSINLGTGMLASTQNKDSRVKLTGKFTYAVKINPNGAKVIKRRKDLAVGEVFVVNDGKSGKQYANFGRLNTGEWFAINLGSRDYALGKRSDKRVSVIGTVGLAVEAV